MRRVRLGSSGPEISALGFGTGAISGGNRPVSEVEALATLNAALDNGVDFIDGGDFYGAGRGELLTAKAMRGRRREDVVLSVKYGALLGVDGVWRGHDTSAAMTKCAITYSLTRLGTDYIDVYRPARIENVPIEETIGAVGDLVDQGYVRHIALSEVGPDTLRRACAERPIVDVQLEYSLLYRGIETSMLDTCRELGVSVTAFAVLSRGLLSDRWAKAGALEAGDSRAGNPRFQGGNLEHNIKLVAALRDIGRKYRLTVSQLAFAWIASRGDDIVPLLGARTATQVDETLSALDSPLPAECVAEIERAVPAGSVAGRRYPDGVLAKMDASLG